MIPACLLYKFPLPYVYLLWGHDEYGPDGMVVTEARDKVLELAEDHELCGDEEIARLKELLSMDDHKLVELNEDGWKLSHGWGGLHFQVVRLK